jgi:hypothetical protein
VAYAADKMAVVECTNHKVARSGVRQVEDKSGDTFDVRQKEMIG